MKTLLVLRHAKTQSDAPAGDHARELIERGHRNAEAMGRLEKTDRNGADRAIDMLLKKINRQPFTTEVPMEAWDDIASRKARPRHGRIARHRCGDRDDAGRVRR